MESNYNNSIGFILSHKINFKQLAKKEICDRFKDCILINESEHFCVYKGISFSKVINSHRIQDLIFALHIAPYMISRNLSEFSSVDDLLKYINNSLIVYLNIINEYVVQVSTDDPKNVDIVNAIHTAIQSYLSKRNIKIVNSWKCANNAISIYIVNSILYIGISKLSDNITPWKDGKLYFSKKEIISRAEFKIEEAFNYFKIGHEIGENALDLGAAPGGWSHFLCKKGLIVDAVDPAQLDNKITNIRSITHYKMSTQAFIKYNRDKMYEIIVNDMKMDAKKSAKILCDVSMKLSKNNGCCILTIKLPKSYAMKVIGETRHILESHFKLVRIKQLYYNRSEVTAFVRDMR